MSCKLLIHLVSLAFIFNAFWICNGDSQKTNHGNLDSHINLKRAIFKTPAFRKLDVKRSVAENENFGEYDEYYFPGSDEQQCPGGYYWHVRGFKCVPFECPGGNQFRDKHTGDCTLRSYGLSTGDNRGPQSRFLK